MKNIKISLIALLFAVSCGDLTEMNVNKKGAEVVEAPTLFANAQKTMADLVNSTSVNVNVWKLYAQYWTETTYFDESQYDLTTRAIPDNVWSILYRDVLRDLKESKVLTEADGSLPAAVKNNRLAAIEVMNVYAYSELVVIFGNVPYTEALDFDNTKPKYDDALTIYKDLIVRLTAAIASIDATADGFDDSDLYYAGDAAAWKKFANSLKLRLAITLADADATTAGTAIQQAAAGAFASNDDNAVFGYLSAPPNTNPIWVSLVQSGRQDFISANTFVDKLNSLSDPRIHKYFEPVTGTTYTGGIYGTSNAFPNYSHVDDAIQEPDFPGVLMSYAEVRFILAEAAARGIGSVVGTADAHYTAAITASMEQWGVASADVTAYLAQPSVAYATATGTYKEKIGTQKWIALYLEGLQAWTEWRRLDYPVLNPPPTFTYSQIPVRFSYPVREQNLNEEQRSAAATAIGGDVVSTRLFFDTISNH